MIKTRTLIIGAAVALALDVGAVASVNVAYGQERASIRDRVRDRIESRIDKWHRGPLIRQLRAELIKARQERRYYRGEADRLNRELAEERAKPRPQCPAAPETPACVPLPPPKPPVRSKF